MNFLQGQIVAGASGFLATGPGFELALPHHSRDWRGAENGIVVGIRPTAISLSPRPGSLMQMSVIVSEYLGASAVLAARCGDTQVLIETTSAKSYRPGEAITCSVAPEHIMIFDKKSGQRL